ncbi:hypothetical protein [Stigmatella erecta]|uniref:DUF3592 domain-containing protein n=1 Tax=Stigmatella erecta TaxID=83460 RepID=A0A1I0KI27_9BACT|nr:hypothetical protein [Stigmatella erecta]SEU24270.1 hypothetical protein SAMN05443639_11131 [Stigmatella erecta]
MRWVGLWLLGAICLGFSAGAVAFGVKAAGFTAHSVSVPGVISGYTPLTCTSTDKDKRKYSYTCYQYRVRYALQGVSHEAPVEQDRPSTTDRLGETVELRVDPRTNTVYFPGVGPWLGCIFFAVFGLLSLAGTVLYFRSNHADSAQRLAALREKLVLAVKQRARPAGTAPGDSRG